MNPAPTFLDPRRAVQVLADGADRRSLGSGYQVTAELVLTAEHVVASAQAVTVRFVDGPRHVREVPAHTVWAHTPADLAVLRLQSASAELTPVRFGRLGGPADCEAIGYPWFKLRNQHRTADGANLRTHRESHHARGSASPHSNRRTGTIELIVTAPLAHPDPGRSAWEGMSGAAVFAGGCLVGVITHNYGHEGPGWLTAHPVTAWYSDAPDAHLAELHSLLALPAASRLAVIGIVGERKPGLRQLPPDTALFTGRSNELERLLDLAKDAGAGDSPGTVIISAIDGMGGAGKTALAIRAGHLLADRFPDGQLFLDLYGFTADTVPRDPGDALSVLLNGLGIPPYQIPADVDARAALYRDRLAGTRTLVVLDNAADEAQVRPLLPAADTCLVLVTSRRRLKALDDAIPLPLDVLPLGEAVALLRKAARLRINSAEDQLLEQVAELCGRLPLALVIAGALLRTGGEAWSLHMLIDRLTAGRPGDELAGHTDDTRSLAAVFDLSYRHLPADLPLLFRRVGLLPGPEIDAYAAAALLDSDTLSAGRRLQRLADHSLITGTSPGRYRIHDLIRAYSRGLAVTLDPLEQRGTTRDRLLYYYAHTAQMASEPIARLPRLVLDGPAPAHAPDLPDPETARAWLRTEYPNLDAAYIHAHTHHLDHHAIVLGAGVAEILLTDGPWTRALEIHQTAAEAAARLDQPTAQATALNDLGRMQYATGDIPGAAHAHAQALEIYREHGTHLGEANALNGLGRVRFATGDSTGAEDAYVRALEIYRGLDNHLGEANTLSGLGEMLCLTGDFVRAVDAHVKALEIYRRLGNRLGEAGALSHLGQVRHLTGDYPEATDVQEQALEIYRRLGYRLGEARVLIDLGLLWLETGDFARAADAQTQALEIFRVVGYRVGEANTLNDSGRVRLATGDYPGAAEVLEQALDIFRQLGDRDGEAWTLNFYAAAVAALGDQPRAFALYHQALAMNQELHKPDDEAISLEGLADHHLVIGDPAQGIAYLNQALEIYQRLGMHADIERVRTRLGNSPYRQGPPTMS